MEIEYMKVPIHRYTFSIKKVKLWIESECKNLYTLNLFAGMTKLDIDEIRIDEDINMPADYHSDAFDFVVMWEKYLEDNSKFDAIILDPPYGYRKSMEFYNGHQCSKFNKLKDVLPAILKKNGKVITFGYHSISMGKDRGFVQDKILLMYHSGAIHDTIAVVERYE